MSDPQCGYTELLFVIVFSDSPGQRGGVPEGGGRRVEHPLRQAGQDCQERR
jgi:hypothetical protein